MESAGGLLFKLCECGGGGGGGTLLAPRGGGGGGGAADPAPPLVATGVRRSFCAAPPFCCKAAAETAAAAKAAPITAAAAGLHGGVALARVAWSTGLTCGSGLIGWLSLPPFSLPFLVMARSRGPGVRAAVGLGVDTPISRAFRKQHRK